MIFTLWGKKNEFAEILDCLLKEEALNLKSQFYVLKHLIQHYFICNPDKVQPYLAKMKSIATQDLFMQIQVVFFNNILMQNFENVVDPKGIDSGDISMVNAANLMNPYNQGKNNLIAALALLKVGMEKTPQLGDIFLAYIQCQILLNPQYPIDKTSLMHDTYIAKYFLSIEIHHGFLWDFFSSLPGFYNNQIGLLAVLAEVIKKQVSVPGKNIKDYATALGSPESFLALRADICRAQKPARISCINMWYKDHDLFARVKEDDDISELRKRSSFTY